MSALAAGGEINGSHDVERQAFFSIVSKEASVKRRTWMNFMRLLSDVYVPLTGPAHPMLVPTAHG